MPAFSNEITFWTSTIAQVATVVTLVFLAIQVFLSLKQSRVSFENEMTKEYRSILQKIDYRAMFNEPLKDEDAREKARNEIYNYVDLCNEQVFLAMQGKVSSRTWILWRDGIRTNLQRPFFSEMWQEIKERDRKSFSELREVEENGFPDDIRSHWFFGCCKKKQVIPPAS